MELIQAIALLCQISVGGMGMNAEMIERRQNKCHKYYVKCFEKKSKDSGLDTPESKLYQCILERETD